MAQAKKKRIGIIFGGRSSEHEVSISSARSILNVIDPAVFDIVLIGITHNGEWTAGEDAQKILDGKSVIPKEGIYIPAKPQDGRFAVLGKENNVKAVHILEKIDVIFPVLHGLHGEDGTIQGLLETAGIPYIGAGVASSAVGMDKILMKNLFIAHGLPTVKSINFTRKEWHADRRRYIKEILDTIQFPCFVKPANTGSSVGITKVNSTHEIKGAVEYAAEFDRKILVEKGIDAREIECSVLGNDNPKASIPGEIMPSREFYDYKAKYIDKRSELIIPANISEEKTGSIRELSVTAYKALDCAGMARVDFLLERRSEDIYVNELNTIPGFTSISMYPKLWEASGIPYADLIKELIDLAFERFEDKMNCRVVYTPRTGK